jgi:hypothetical protein
MDLVLARQTPVEVSGPSGFDRRRTVIATLWGIQWLASLHHELFLAIEEEIQMGEKFCLTAKLEQNEL